MTRNVGTFCPETCTFAPNLEQRNHWSVEKPPLELLTVNRFGEFQALWMWAITIWMFGRSSVPGGSKRDEWAA